MEIVCGIDEVGRGCLAGPIVASVVAFPDGYKIDGVRDSKKLTSEQRDSLFEKIMNECVAYAIGVADNNVIDDKGITYANMEIFDTALDSISQKLNFNTFKLYVDGILFALPSKKTYNYTTVIGGDDLIFTISSASIIAKVTRDRMMNEYSKQFPLYSLDKNKGYGTPEHIEAIKINGLSDIHRRSFCRNITVNTFF